MSGPAIHLGAPQQDGMVMEAFGISTPCCDIPATSGTNTYTLRLAHISAAPLMGDET